MPRKQQKIDCPYSFSNNRCVNEEMAFPATNINSLFGFSSCSKFLKARGLPNATTAAAAAAAAAVPPPAADPSEDRKEEEKEVVDEPADETEPEKTRDEGRRNDDALVFGGEHRERVE